jgi:NAD+ kinase
VTEARVRAIGLVPHRERERAHELARASASWLTERGVDVRVPAADAAASGLERLAADDDAFTSGLDLAISLGGDGTMLRTVDLVYESGAAVLGVNVGHMGYLTEVEPKDLDDSLVRLLSGDFEVEERMVLEVVLGSRGVAAGRRWALNEIVIEKTRDGRLARLDVDINGTPFTTYVADGVIIATPTGSTAYSFSARGPIVSPRHRCLLLTPVSPHMLFDRSLVLDADEELRFTVADGATVVVMLDGRELGQLETGDTVTCTGGPKPARLVTFGPRDFHQILKAKFGLPDR